MLTFVFLLIFGGIVVGFMVWLTMFRKGRKSQAPQSQVNAQRDTPTPGRATGAGDN